jgi:hypothetical protein
VRSTLPVARRSSISVSAATASSAG